MESLRRPSEDELEYYADSLWDSLDEENRKFFLSREDMTEKLINHLYEVPDLYSLFIIDHYTKKKHKITEILQFKTFEYTNITLNDIQLLELDSNLIVKISTEIEYIVDIINNLYKIGVKLPYISIGLLGNVEVLIIEKLYKIDNTDLVRDIAFSLLDDLEKMYPYMSYQDLKPANIMKRRNGEYFLIDYDSIVSTKHESGIGYRHEIFTSIFASTKGYGIYTAYNMLTELIYTIYVITKTIKKGESMDPFSHVLSYLVNTEEDIWLDFLTILDSDPNKELEKETWKLLRNSFWRIRY